MAEADDAGQDRVLAREALKSYGLEATRVRLAAREFNTIFRVTARDASYALRVGSRLRVPGMSTADAERRWTDRLREDGYRAPRLVPAADGRAAVEVSGRECVMFEWVAGRGLPPTITTARALAIGRLAAQLHEHAASWQDATPHDVLRGDRTLYWRLPNRLPGLDSTFGSLFVDAVARADEVIAALWGDPLRRPHVLHADLHPWNVLSVRQLGLVPIDFQDMIWGFDVQDIAITQSALRRAGVADEVFSAFMRGYSEVRAWPDATPELLESLIAARRLNQINLTINNRPELPADYLPAQADFLRRWLTERQPLG